MRREKVARKNEITMSVNARTNEKRFELGNENGLISTIAMCKALKCTESCVRRAAEGACCRAE
jgi:hypothetical protein